MKTVFVSELDGNAQKTHLANFGKEIDIAGDITIVPESSVPVTKAIASSIREVLINNDA